MRQIKSASTVASLGRTDRVALAGVVASMLALAFPGASVAYLAPGLALLLGMFLIVGRPAILCGRGSYASFSTPPSSGCWSCSPGSGLTLLLPLLPRGAGDSLDRIAAEGGGGYGRVGGRVPGRGRRLGGHRCARFYPCDLEDRPHRALLCGRRVPGLRDAGFQEAR